MFAASAGRAAPAAELTVAFTEIVVPGFRASEVRTA